MTKILFSLFSNISWLSEPKIDPFYEGFITTLIEQNNDVMVIRTNDFLSSNMSNTLFNYIDEKKLVKHVADFNPELIITANNHIPRIILDSFDLPILLWSSDSPTWYADKEYIKRNNERYKFFHHGWGKTQIEVCQKIFHSRLNQNFSIGHATRIQAKEESIISNITFIGTIGYPEKMLNYLKFHCNNNFELEKLNNFYEKTYNSPLNDISNNFDAKLKVVDFHHTITSNNRIKTLDALIDLGLKVYGYPLNFFNVAPYSMDLAFCFDYTPIASLANTEAAFNSTKIGINLYNAQAAEGFSWRVADIMASNACLISPYKEDLIKINPYIKMPTFQTPEEARELCKKLLKDEIWRKEIVTASQKAINEHGRFEHIFKKIEEIFNIKLLNESPFTEKRGNLITLQYQDFINLRFAPLFFISQKVRSSNATKNFFKKLIIKLLTIIPKNTLKKIHHFLLSLKDEV